VYTIAETPTFVADADKLWSEEERMEFFVWLAANPEAGDVIPESGGCRKVRFPAPAQASVAASGSSISLACHPERFGCSSCIRSP